MANDALSSPETPPGHILPLTYPVCCNQEGVFPVMMSGRDFEIRLRVSSIHVIYQHSELGNSVLDEGTDTHRTLGTSSSLIASYNRKKGKVAFRKEVITLNSCCPRKYLLVHTVPRLTYGTISIVYAHEINLKNEAKYAFSKGLSKSFFPSPAFSVLCLKTRDETKLFVVTDLITNNL